MSQKKRLGWPNRITIGRMLLIGPFVVCLLNQDTPGNDWLRWAAVGVFGLMAASDFLDGLLARRLHDESDLGKFLDPLADKLLITSAVLILSMHGILAPSPEEPERKIYLPNWVAVAAIGKDLIVSIGFGLLHLLTGAAKAEPRWLGKWCTMVQLVLVLALLVQPDFPAELQPLSGALALAATALAIAAALDYVRIGARQLAEAQARAEG